MKIRIKYNNMKDVLIELLIDVIIIVIAVILTCILMQTIN